MKNLLKSLVFSASLAAAVGLSADVAQAADTLTMADFVYTNKLVVAGYTGSETLANFPVLVRISTSLGDFQYSRMRSSKGGDLAFFAEDGTRLASEVDTWSTSGTSLVWVKLPSMAQGTPFYMCYRLTDELAALDTMVDNPNPWGDYVGVWHMRETGKNKQIFESSTNALHGYTAVGSGISAGAIGAGRLISEDNNHAYGIVVDATNGVRKSSADALGVDFHASFWIMAQNGKAVQWANLVCRRKGDNGNSWGVAFHENISGGNVPRYMRVYSGSTTANTTSSPHDLGLALSAQDGVWKKVDVVWRYDSAADRQYADISTNGVYVETVALDSKVRQSNCNIGIGCSTQDDPKNEAGHKGRRFSGFMDEVRLKPGIPGADWVKADFDTVNDERFVVADVLTVSWANNTGLAGHTYDGAVFGGFVQKLGDASSCSIQCKVWGVGQGEPGEWTTLTNALVAGDSFEVAVTGCEASLEYNYALRAVGSDSAETPVVAGTFFTDSGLNVRWTDLDAEAPGIAYIAYDYVSLRALIVALGGADYCMAQGKYWKADGEEPSDWSQLSGALGDAAAFSGIFSGLEPGTTYRYVLRMLGNDGEATTPVGGVFTTQGQPGDKIGTDETHFFYDGNNAYWVANEFERYKQFCVTGYTGTAVLTNFPVLLDLRPSDGWGFTYDDFYHPGGKDMAFVDERGRIIPHEIDTWNPNGMSLVWIRIPELKKGVQVTMCYRSSLVNPPDDLGNTFERYVGVWHMNERQDGVTEVADSTTNNLVGEAHANSLAEDNGRVGYARRVAQSGGASSSTGRILVFEHDNILQGVGPVFTYSGWYKLAKGTTNPDWAYLVSRKSDDNTKGWGIQYDNQQLSAKQLRVWAADEGKNNYDAFNIEGVGYKHDEWSYWTFVYSNQTFHAYYKGAELASTAGGFALKKFVSNDENSGFQDFVIGGMLNGKGALNGYVDEARYSKGVRSADWIKAEYDSMLQVDKPFVAKMRSSPVGRGPESLVPVVVWEKGSDMPNTIIDVSYAYVQFAGTVTFCGSGAETCSIEYQIWADGEEIPGEDEWTTLLADAVRGTVFSIPVCGLKQDMPYNFRIRAVNEVDGVRRLAREHTGAFRTLGNVNESADGGELIRIDNRFVHRFRAGEYTFTTLDYVTNVEIAVVGGGGAGGYKVGGGGGGGGVFYSAAYRVETNTTYRITVGKGGTAVSSTSAASSEGNGKYSFFARDDDPSHPLISVPGGGGGGNYSDAKGRGADGGSGGGGTYAKSGGSQVSNEVDGVYMTYGTAGGAGNVKSAGNDEKCAAGGGGGAVREGLVATSDNWYFGGAGGMGLVCGMTGETLYLGAGGGGGYIYKAGQEGHTGPGTGGSGFGGNGADVGNGIPATSGVANTGGGGGGGSMSGKSSSNATYWQGADGADGVVLISYEVHGRDPVSEEPRITMTRCDYDIDRGFADIGYRLYWAGVQTELADVYVHYSTVGPEELTNNAAGGWAKVDEATVGIDETVFVPPEVGHTYWVRLVGRRSANSYCYSEEIASFEVPAVSLRGATWTESKISPDGDYATVMYRLYDVKETTHLYCYWSETQADLEGDDSPEGVGVYLLDLGPNTGTNLSSSTTFRLPATEGLERNKTYYLRLACGDADGVRRFLTKEIVSIDTAEKPVTVLAGASWSDTNVATVEFTAKVGTLDPAHTELVALYSLVESDVTAAKPEANASVTNVVLGHCSDLALDSAQSSATFPLWSSEVTNYYVRIALATNGVIVAGSYSQATMTIPVSHAVEQNTLIYIVTANPRTMCYGDSPLPLSYTFGGYAGTTSGYGWEHKYGFEGDISCDVTSATPAGNYTIGQGTFMLEGGGQDQKYTDPDTGIEGRYQHKLAFSEATYTVSNAVFAARIADVTTNYTGAACDADVFGKTVTGVRNGQTVTYQYRVGGAGEWTPAPAFTNVGHHAVQFVASAPSHDDVHGTFMVTVEPAPLTATIEDVNANYTGGALTPDVVTNVTGLVRGDLNPLTCEFRDESGEWQESVPTFTMPGTYTLFFRASAPNHAEYVTNCTVTINPWDFNVNMDGATGYETPIIVGRPEWLVSNNLSGLSGVELADAATRYGALDAVCPNGLRLWQNYVIERKDFGKRVVATIMQHGDVVDQNSFVVHFPDIEPLMGTGLRVQYRIDRKLRGGMSRSEFDAAPFVEGGLNGRYEANIPLATDDPEYDPTGLYVFNIVFSPTNELLSGQSVIPSCATIGVLRVSSVLTNAVISAPWLSMSLDTTNEVDVAVANVVNPFSIASGDAIHAYETDSGTFRVWERRAGGSWKGPATVTGDGVSEISAEVATFERGKAFWLVRSDPGSEGATNYIYLVGRYTGGEYEIPLEPAADAENPGYTLVANPTMFDMDLNDLAFVDGEGRAATPDAGDTIKVMDIAGHETIYYRSGENDKWGRTVTTVTGRRVKREFVEGGVIPAGTGFWYNRKGEGAFKIKFGSAE